jgi:lactate dehydrogenase-like 2-hydroxyacid dehydrogenase
VVDDATADTAMFLILAALRGFNNGIMAIQNGTWKGAVPPPPLGHDPQGKVLGILGMGGIGRNLKKKAEVFDMNIIYHNRKRLDAEQADGAEYVSFEDLLTRSDVLRQPCSETQCYREGYYNARDVLRLPESHLRNLH